MLVFAAANAFDQGQVLILVVLFVIPIAAIAFAASGAALRELGKGPFAIEQELPHKTMAAAVPVSREVLEAEIRQMLEAKSYRGEMRGRPPLDIEAELSRALDAEAALPAPRIDAELREEVRGLVLARNERRMRKGQPPLDIDEEIERQLRDLENLGQ